ncbi:sensor domain-containing diguanylate cyclase [Cellulomonas endophytica]|uniref:GGDEF domain-containing protein n=1 Tax=Cellulomonas endophytica TaxID=2494735 RepID=UPI00196B9AFF|nr:sensor domain-containing diguanylate cyclase [Cellulomonas endophytica]
MSAGPAPLVPFAGFAEAAQDVLGDLRRRAGLRLWMVTRRSDDRQVVLLAQDSPDGYGMAAGAVLSWPGSLCAVMVDGRSPHVAPHVAQVPALAAAPNRQGFPIEAYVGMPLVRADGEVFGTLCGFDPEPQPASLRELEPLVRLQARLLSTLLDLELQAEDLHRRLERAEGDATTDALTGLGNRRGWDAVLAAEEARAVRYGHPAAVVVLDVDGLKAVNDRDGHDAGDALLRRCAAALRGSARSADYLARLGGDEFAVLAVETGPAGAAALEVRLRAALDAAAVPVAAGTAERAPGGTLPQAWRAADAAMYENKRRRRA